MEESLIFTSIVSLIVLIFTIYWMTKMLSLTKQSRILHSMSLKVILEYCQKKGVDIDIQKIQKEVEDSVG